MFSRIYLEHDVEGHVRTRSILERFPDAEVIPCERYTEIFNRKAQSFRLQKKNPALILATKFKNHVLPAPANYGIGSENNFYFSHMLNCIYDCRYCFLQGMYQSANYVLFVNYEDFEAAILERIQADNSTPIHFFSGYDCDSLAFEPVTGFAKYFLGFAQQHPDNLFEFRTKSTQVRVFLDTQASDNIVAAFSFTPAEISRALEHKVPAVEKRLEAMVKLQQQGWHIGLRFDPVIYSSDYQAQYGRLFSTLFNAIDDSLLHSVSLGSFRLPKDFFQAMTRLYPDELLFASPLDETDGLVSYKKAIHNETLGFCHNELLKYIPEAKFFPCG